MRQLVNGKDARPCDDQPTAACSDCPWARASLKGWLGSLSVEEWLAVAHREASADCHALTKPDGGAWACAGLAIYRSNVGKLPRDRKVQKLPADRALVFATPAEFKRHHETVVDGKVMIDGWWHWAEDCPACGVKEDADPLPHEEPRPFALTCPVCELDGCSVCFPMGRGCACPACDDD